MEPRKCGGARGRRGRKKYIARNTSDSAIGVPHTSRMAAEELLSTAVARCGASRSGNDGPKDTLVPGALRIYRKFNITQKLETARGILPDIYTV